MIVTDRSGLDAGAPTSRPNRLAAAKKAAGTFLDALPDKVRVGAVAFNQKAEVLQSPTRDHDAVREAIAVDQARRHDRHRRRDQRPRSRRITGKAPAAIVLLSDGKSVRGSDPLAAAQAAKARKIPIYTVALGTANGTINGGAARAARPADARRDRPAHRRQRLHRRATSRRSTRSTSASAPRSRPRSSKLEVTSLFAGGALALMVLSALSLDPLVRPPPLTLPLRLPRNHP